MSDEELMAKIKNIQGLLWRPFVDELLIRSKKWFQDRDHAADRIEQLERERDGLVSILAQAGAGLRLLQRAEEAEAKLAKAVDALRVALEGLNWAKAYLSTGGIDSMEVDHADATVYAALAELEGMK